MDGRALQVSISRTGSSAAVLRVIGEIDVSTTPQLRSVLHQLADDQSVQRIVIDLDGVEFIDSSGLGALIGCSRRMKARGLGRQLMLVCNRMHLLRVFKITGLDYVFHMNATVLDALDA